MKTLKFIHLIGFIALFSLISCNKEYITNEYITNEYYTNEYYYDGKFFITDQEEITKDICPPYLQKGDTVAIFAASNAVSKSEVKNGIEKLESWGLNVITADNLYLQNGRYAGELHDRINALQKLLDNPNVKALISARGGYGAAQVLPYIDFDKFTKNPKWIVGYSDVTAIHAAVNNMGIETIHGPMAYKLTHANSVESLRKALFGELSSYSISTNSNCIVGSGEGRLVGGNLSIIYSLGGTIFDLNTQNAILFIEDTNESNYHIDRMMTNLKLSGKLDCLKGVIIGSFTNMTQGSDLPINEIMKDKLESLGIPVVYGINIGHDTENLALYFGKTVKIDVNNDKATITYK
ncbi:MAG: LD-carboxypeptidase [Paludibacteraceae bacterium]|nr:LD-carboxypeptidase [Paludibacteraceae bacterium]